MHYNYLCTGKDSLNRSWSIVDEKTEMHQWLFDSDMRDLSADSHSSETVLHLTATQVNKMILFLKQASQQSLQKSSPQRWQRCNSLPVSQRVKHDLIQSEIMPIRRLNWHLITTLKRLMGH